jgi:hypothetical protein
MSHYGIRPVDRSCGSYGPGHQVHWIQAKKSVENPQPVVRGPTQLALRALSSAFQFSVDGIVITTPYHDDLHDILTAARARPEFPCGPVTDAEFTNVDAVHARFPSDVSAVVWELVVAERE